MILHYWLAQVMALSQSTYSNRRTAIRTIAGTFTSTSFIATSPPSFAKSTISTEELREIYNEGASTYESLYSESIVSRTLDFPTLRSNLLSKAEGDVLELGVGTGLNLPQYPSSIPSIKSYTALDLSPKMMERAREKFAKGFPNVAASLEALYEEDKVHFRIGDVNELTLLFNGKKFDTIIDTFGLCVFPDPLNALKEARKCLNSGGKLIMLEHQDSLLGKALNPTRNIADVISTCRYDDDVLGLLKGAGFKSVSSKSYAGGFLIEVVAKEF